MRVLPRRRRSSPLSSFPRQRFSGSFNSSFHASKLPSFNLHLRLEGINSHLGKVFFLSQASPLIGRSLWNMNNFGNFLRTYDNFAPQNSRMIPVWDDLEFTCPGVCEPKSSVEQFRVSLQRVSGDRWFCLGPSRMWPTRSWPLRCPTCLLLLVSIYSLLQVPVCVCVCWSSFKSVSLHQKRSPKTPDPRSPQAWFG